MKNIVEKSLLFDIHHLVGILRKNKNNQNKHKFSIKNKFSFFETLNNMDIYFKSFLSVNDIVLSYEKKEDRDGDIKCDDVFDNNISKEDLYNINKDVKDLIEKYKNNKFSFKSMFNEVGINGEKKENKEVALSKELLILMFLNYKKLFYLSESCEDYHKYECFIFINNCDENLEKSKKLIDKLFNNEKRD